MLLMKPHSALSQVVRSGLRGGQLKGGECGEEGCVFQCPFQSGRDEVCKCPRGPRVPTEKIFGAKRDEVTGEWIKLHNAELHAMSSSPDIFRNIKSRRLRWAGRVARMGESRNAYRVLVEKPEGIRPLGRSRCRWEDNIKMDLREVGYDRDWINLAQNRDRWRAAMNLRVS
ncbi:hypothetical protein ANN_08269 [Periplaneta americana]|uniref:Uncharacterized protein n=1 Tax=Periplaneta americana TaxID=6978 RepID=A0ABQ8T2B8_PERAM|nr:hypothetical protein ANN_08269 [Periplaneta americana]